MTYNSPMKAHYPRLRTQLKESHVKAALTTALATLGLFVLVSLFGNHPRSNFLEQLLPSALVLALSSGVVAGISGYLSARRLAWRFDAMTQAADAWARGDFTAMAPEAGDEMGMLANRLNRMAAELRDLMALRQDVATLEERNRLARDLHDTVKQHLFAASMQIGAAKALLPAQPDQALARLDAANDLAQQAQRDLTAVLQELRPVSAQGAPLAILLKGHVSDWSRRNSIPTTFESDELPPLSPEATNGLLRVAQEALANASKHSEATRVEVSLRRDDAGGVRLLVRDNGRGFDARQRRLCGGEGFGLHTMRERAQGLPGGRLQLLSTPGAGCCIVVRCDSVARPARMDDFLGMEDAIRML